MSGEEAGAACQLQDLSASDIRRQDTFDVDHDGTGDRKIVDRVVCIGEGIVLSCGELSAHFGIYDLEFIQKELRS